MGIGNYIKKTIKNNTNIKNWMDWNALKSNGRALLKFAQVDEANQSTSEQKMTFEETMQHFGMSHDDLKNVARSHFLVAMACLILGFAALIWFFVLLFKTMFLSSLMSIALAFLMFAYAFREHFCYFQLKQKRLDCTVKEWALHFFRKG